MFLFFYNLSESGEFILPFILQTIPAPPLKKDETRMYYSMRIYIILYKHILGSYGIWRDNRTANENGLKAQQAHSPGQSEAAPRVLTCRTPPAP